MDEVLIDLLEQDDSILNEVEEVDVFVEMYRNQMRSSHGPLVEHRPRSDSFRRQHSSSPVTSVHDSLYKDGLQKMKELRTRRLTLVSEAELRLQQEEERQMTLTKPQRTRSESKRAATFEKLYSDASMRDRKSANMQQLESESMSFRPATNENADAIPGRQRACKDPCMDLYSKGLAQKDKLREKQNEQQSRKRSMSSRGKVVRRSDEENMYRRLNCPILSRLQ